MISIIKVSVCLLLINQFCQGLTVPNGEREFDGTNSNIDGNILAGVTGANLLRLGTTLPNITNFPHVLGSFYTDGISIPRTEDQGFPNAFIVPESANIGFPSGRLVSTIVSSLGNGLQVNPRLQSDWLSFWGQYIDHDFGLTEGIAMEIVPGVNQSLPIIVPMNDPNAEFLMAGQLPFNRANFDPLTGNMAGNPRQQVNQITSYVDANVVYGQNNDIAQAIRDPADPRFLLVEGDLPSTVMQPLSQVPGVVQNNPVGLVNNDELFAAGEPRANENIALLAIHTLFVREHNRLAATMDDLDDEAAFFQARKINMALHQQVNFNEYAPNQLGDFDLDEYNGPVSGVDGGSFNEFTQGAFRYGHTELNTDIPRFDPVTGEELPAIDLSAAFFNTNVDGRRINGNDLDSVMLGMALQQQRAIDPFVINDLREALFGNGPMMGQDLIALNIQRARDCGLPTFQDFRRILAQDLPANHPDPSLFADYTSFDDMRMRNPMMTQSIDFLEMAYGPSNASLELVDMWVGMLAEDHAFNSQFGPTLHEIIRRQYTNYRDGDAFYFDQPLPRGFSDADRNEIRSTLLSDIILRNSNIQQIPCNVMAFNDGMICFANSASTAVASFTAIVAAFVLLF